MTMLSFLHDDTLFTARVSLYHLSRVAIIYDNAAMENFLRHTKNRMFVLLYFTTRAEVEQFVAVYVDFYNFERIILKRGLIPVETRSKTA